MIKKSIVAKSVVAPSKTTKITVVSPANLAAPRPSFSAV